MKRLTAYVSGKVQVAGYRARVTENANALSLKGSVQNLDDGRVKIIAEGENEALETFLRAIDIKDAIIRVDSISSDYSKATGDYDRFFKLVGEEETATRIDFAALALKEVAGGLEKVVSAVNNMNSNLGSKIDNMHSDIREINANQVKMLDKQDKMLEKQDKSLEMQAQTLTEIKGLRVDVQSGDAQHIQMQADIKAIKARLGMP